MEKQIVSIMEFSEMTGLSDYVVRRLIKEKEGKTVISIVVIKFT